MSGKTDKKKKTKKQSKDTEVYPDSLYKQWEHPEPAEAGVDIPEPANLPRFTQQRPSALQRPVPVCIRPYPYTPPSPVSPAFGRRTSSGSDAAASNFLAYNVTRNLQANQQSFLELRRRQIENAAGNTPPSRTTSTPQRTTSSPYNTNPYADPHNVSDNTSINIITQMFNSLGGFGGEGLDTKNKHTKRHHRQV